MTDEKKIDLDYEKIVMLRKCMGTLFHDEAVPNIIVAMSSFLVELYDSNIDKKIDKKVDLESFLKDFCLMTLSANREEIG